MIRRILLPLSGSPLTPDAVQTAVELARRHGAHLTGLSFRGPSERAWLSPLGGASGVTRTLAGEEERVWRRIAEASSQFITACQARGVAYDLAMPTGDPFEVLLTHGGAYDLTVFGLRGLFDHPLVGNPRRLMARLIAGGLGPTFAVCGPPPPEPQALLIALSGSPASLRALRDCVQLGLYPEAGLHLLHIGEDRAMLERAAALARDHGREVASLTARSGPVLRTLRAAVRDHHCGLVVMGDSGRSLLARDVLGDVALAMMRDSDTPLLLSH